MHIAVNLIAGLQRRRRVSARVAAALGRLVEPVWPGRVAEALLPAPDHARARENAERFRRHSAARALEGRSRSDRAG